MRVLNSTTAFGEHYAVRREDFKERAVALGKGAAAMGGVAGTSALAVGAFAAQASAWSAFAGWPLIGGMAAGKATAAGVAAGLSALGGAPVLVPALAVGGVVAYMAYRGRARQPCQRGSSVEEVADAFARVAWLPMLAAAASLCIVDPACRDDVRNYVLREMGAWGYAESYVQAAFKEALATSPCALYARYGWLMDGLAAGRTDGTGATPGELPPDVVAQFADEFRTKLESCVV